MHINDLLKMASERKASDLHLKVGSHPVLRINGELIPLVETKRLMQEDTIAMAFSIMSNRQKQKFKDNLEIDIAYSVPGLGRFRCNVFQQRGTVGLVLRVIPVKIMTVRELGLHQHPALRARHHHRGSDRVPPPRQKVDSQSARGGGGYPLLRGRPAERSAAGSRRHPGR